MEWNDIKKVNVKGIDGRFGVFFQIRSSEKASLKRQLQNRDQNKMRSPVMEVKESSWGQSIPSKCKGLRQDHGLLCEERKGR